MFDSSLGLIPPSHFPPSPLTSFCSCGPLSLPRTVAASHPRWEPLLLGSSELTAGASRPGGSVPPLLTPRSSDILGMTSDLALALQKAGAPSWTPCLHSWLVDMKWVFANLTSRFYNPRFLSFQCTHLLCPPFSADQGSVCAVGLVPCIEGEKARGSMG